MRKSAMMALVVALGTAALNIAPCAAQADAAALRVDTLWANVHNHRMVFYVSGDTASPVVILEAGGASHRAWQSLTPEIARFARVVTYDRPGYGQSDPCAHPRSAAVIAEELHEALNVLRIRPPYVLGGWSLGGSFVRVFGAKYPDIVAGLVLIDPAPDGFYDRAARERPEIWAPMLAEQDRRNASAPQGVRDEWSAWDVTLREARESDRDLKAPVTLLTATRDEDGLQSIWIEEHQRWAKQVPDVRHFLVQDAGHAIHRDKPGVVLQALRNVLGLTDR